MSEGLVTLPTFECHGVQMTPVEFPYFESDEASQSHCTFNEEDIDPRPKEEISIGRNPGRLTRSLEYIEDARGK